MVWFVSVAMVVVVVVASAVEGAAPHACVSAGKVTLEKSAKSANPPELPLLVLPEAADGNPAMLAFELAWRAGDLAEEEEEVDLGDVKLRLGRGDVAPSDGCGRRGKMG